MLMRKALYVVGLAFLSLTPLGRGAPVTGTSWSFEKVAPGTVRNGTVTDPGSLHFPKTYVGGQRAAVIVIGDHNPAVDIEVKVYDDKNQLVAADRGTGPAKDFAAAVWYPPRQATYRIEVYSYGTEYNQISIAFK
jgi:hypothetical protein